MQGDRSTVEVDADCGLILLSNQRGRSRGNERNHEGTPRLIIVSKNLFIVQCSWAPAPPVLIQWANLEKSWLTSRIKFTDVYKKVNNIYEKQIIRIWNVFLKACFSICVSCIYSTVDIVVSHSQGQRNDNDLSVENISLESTYRCRLFTGGKGIQKIQMMFWALPKF